MPITTCQVRRSPAPVSDGSAATSRVRVASSAPRARRGASPTRSEMRATSSARIQDGSSLIVYDSNSPPIERQSFVEQHVWLPLASPPNQSFHGIQQYTLHTYVRFHSAIQVRKPVNDEQKYGLYTYVLFNGTPYHEKLAYDDKLAWRRLSRLLETIAQAGDRADTPNNQALPLAKTNLFLIPANVSATTSVEQGDYDLSRSRLYLSAFRKKLDGDQEMSSHLLQKGPFLLAAPQPLTNLTATTPILLIDLSQAHEKSVAEVVRTFKNHVANNILQKSDSLEPLRIKLISLLLKLNDAIPMVKGAIAAELPKMR